MSIEFVVGSRPCSERFFSGYSGCPLSLKTNASKPQFALDTVPNYHSVIYTVDMYITKVVLFLFLFLFFLTVYPCNEVFLTQKLVGITENSLFYFTLTLTGPKARKLHLEVKIIDIKTNLNTLKATEDGFISQTNMKKPAPEPRSLGQSQEPRIDSCRCLLGLQLSGREREVLF